MPSVTIALTRKLPIGNLAPLLASAASWWLDELRSLLPGRIASRLRRGLDIEAHEGGWRVTVIRFGRVVAEMTASVENPTACVAALKRWGPRGKVILHPPPGSVLSHVLRVPRLALGQFDTLLASEIDRWTPFRHDEILCGWIERNPTNRASPTAEIELRYVEREKVSAWMDELSGIGLVPTALALGPSRSQEVDLKSFAKGQGRRRLLAIGSVLVLLLLAVFGVDAVAARRARDMWQQQADAEQQLYMRQSQLQKRITEIVSTLERSELAKRNPKGALLASLTAVLPEPDWLTEISIKGDIVTLRGYSQKPDLLLASLAKVAVAGEVNLQGEISYDTKTDRMRFAASYRPRSLSN